jgi:hypothetical protein
MNKRIMSVFFSLAIVLGASSALAPAGVCQQAKLSVDSKTGDLGLKAMSSHELKKAISYAALKGDITLADAKELIDKIRDIEVLMAQFDFIREHERSMISTMGSSIH